MAGTVHESLVLRLRISEVDGQIFASKRLVIARLSNPLPRSHTGGRNVSEIVVHNHIVGFFQRSLGKFFFGCQGWDAASFAILVDQVNHALSIEIGSQRMLNWRHHEECHQEEKTSDFEPFFCHLEKEKGRFTRVKRPF